MLTLLYVGLSYFGEAFGRNALYPVRVFVTFLHEFGHAAGALLTGGSVESIEIEPNTAGVTTSIGGNLAVILAGGYIGSALFGNILFYIGAKKPRLVKPVLALVIFAMLVTGFVWYTSVFTTAVLLAFAGFLFWVGFKTKYGRDCLMALGLASVIYILQDTAYGPSSDLAGFEREMRFIPARGWMLLWFAVAAGLLALNLKLLLGLDPESNPK